MLRYLLRFLIVEAAAIGLLTALWLVIFHQYPKPGIYIVFFATWAAAAHKWATKTVNVARRPEELP